MRWGGGGGLRGGEGNGGRREGVRRRKGVGKGVEVGEWGVGEVEVLVQG